MGPVFFQTSEFAVWALTVIGLLIAGAAVTAGPTGDVLRANTVWTLIRGHLLRLHHLAGNLEGGHQVPRPRRRTGGLLRRGGAAG